MREFEIERHNTSYKSFDFSNHRVSVQVDYDDVNHPEVDAGIELMKEILNSHWDEKRFKELYREKVMEVWNKNEYGLQTDFENLEDYLQNYGIEP